MKKNDPDSPMLLEIRESYHFSQDYIRFENDTIGTKKKVNVSVQIQNRIIRNEDSITRVPFEIYRIKDCQYLYGCDV